MLASVGDFVWFDTDRNGLQNNGEAGVPGVTVRLLDPLGAIVQTQLTSSTGSYLFDGLNPGTYAIEFVLTGGGSGGSYAFTTARTGSDVSIDSDADQSTGRSLQFTLMAGDALRTIDAGVVTNTAPTTTIVTLNPTTTTPSTTIPTVTTTPVTTVPGTSTTVPAPTTTLGISVLGNCRIASTIWRDTNGNGVLDGTEVPFSGVTVQAAQGGLVFTATTNERGEYTINNLPCGEWTVTIIGGLPEGVPTPPAKTVRVLGEQVTNDVAPFGIALQSDPALTGGNTLRSLSFALSILGIGGLMATARRRRTSRGRV